VDNRRTLHYMAGRFSPLLHTMHSPYDDNGIFSEEKDGVLGEPGKARTTVDS